MPDVIAMQEALQAMSARALHNAPANCAQTYAGFQYRLTDEGEVSFDALTIGMVSLDGAWRFGQFDQDQQMLGLANDYRAAFGDSPWTTFEITVDADGTFHAEQGFDPTPEEGLDPALLERMENYPKTWTAEHGATPPKKKRWFGR